MPFAYTLGVRRLILFLFVIAAVVLAAPQARSEGLGYSKDRFYYRTPEGRVTSAPMLRHYTVPVIQPDAKIDSRLDPRLCQAATIAEERAHARPRARCWRYVKEALLAAGVIDSYPKSNYASEAGDELVRNYGFTRLPVHDQFAAPIGA